MNTDGSKVDEIGSFNMHLEKLVNMFGFMNADATNDDKVLLKKVLTEFYIQRGMWVKNPEKNDLMSKVMVVGLSHEQYPTLGDFVEYINEVRRGLSGINSHSAGFTDDERKSIARIANTFDLMMSQYGDIFNGTTNITDFSSLDAVDFKVDGLLQHGREVFNAQVSSCLSLISADVVNNGKHYRTLYNDKKIDADDIPYYWITMDEFQNYASPDFTDGVEWIANLMQEMRKNFCGLNVILPTVKDFLPSDNLLSSTDRMNRFRTAMAKIYGLFTYRTFFHLSTDDAESLEQVFRNSVTPGELASIPNLDKHEALMNIDGEGNYTFKVQPTDAQLARFNGGIG